MNHPFPAGTKVQTTETYFEMLGRRITGTTIEHPEALSPPELTVMICETQSGNIIPEYQGNAVLIPSRYLEKIEEVLQ